MNHFGTWSGGNKWKWASAMWLHRRLMHYQFTMDKMGIHTHTQHTVLAAWRPIQLPIKMKRSSCNSTAAFNLKLEEMKKEKKRKNINNMILASGARCEDRVETNSWLHASGMNVRRVRVNCAPTQRDWLDKCREKNKLINYVWPPSTTCTRHSAHTMNARVLDIDNQYPRGTASTEFHSRNS